MIAGLRDIGPNGLDPPAISPLLSAAAPEVQETVPPLAIFFCKPCVPRKEESRRFIERPVVHEYTRDLKETRLVAVE
jgi:hypothetical protein